MFLYKLFFKPLLSLEVCVQTQETKVFHAYGIKKYNSLYMLTQKLLFSQGLCILLITGIWFVVVYIHTYSSSSLYSPIKVSYIQSLAIKMKTALI